MAQLTIQLLLVEDNPGDARLIREMLLDARGQQINFELAATMHEAADHLAKQPYDVILLDLSLPDSYGMETLIGMRNYAPDTAIVVLTGNDDQDLGLQAVQVGAQDYLAKGEVDSKLLVRSLRYAIERYRIEVIVRKREEEYRSLIDDVFDNSAVAVLIMDSHFRTVWCNEATVIYFGIPRERLLGRDGLALIDDELKCIFADPDDYSAKLHTAYEQGTYTDHFECRVTPDTNRKERWLEHWSQPITQGLYAGGRIEQYTEITDRKLLEIAEQQQRQFAEALRDVFALLTGTLNIKEVLERILKNLDRIVPHDSASVTMSENTYVWVVEQRHDQKRDTQEIVAEKQIQSDYRDYFESMFDTDSPVVVPNLQIDPEIQSAAKRANIHSYVGAPIKLQKDIIGFMNVFSEQVDFYNQSHADRLSAFAELAAIAIKNARLYEESQELAAMEERQRLARDLHDSVSQTIFTCRTMAESALRRWERDPNRARELMEEVYQLTLTALAEMRILLLELRPASLMQVNLKQLFEQYLQPIQNRRQFALNMTFDDMPVLPAEVQMALYRIAQEALNNIDKHANAKHVKISSLDFDSHIELHISDDGEGFDFNEIENTSLGLAIMHERAEEIGAALTIESKEHEGTQIIVIWPKKKGLVDDQD